MMRFLTHLLLCQTLVHIHAYQGEGTKPSLLSHCVRELSQSVARLNDDVMQLKRCPLPWIPFEDMCLFFHGVKKSWSEAQQTCILFDGNLLWIRNETEHATINRFLQGRIKRDHGYFLGLHRKYWGGPLEWTGPPNNTYYGKPVTKYRQEEVFFASSLDNMSIFGGRLYSYMFPFVCRRLNS